MAQIGDIIFLATTITFTLIFSLTAIHGLATGRLKSEPSQPWVVFRDRPVRFLLMLLFNLAAAYVCAVGTLKVANRLLQ